MSYLTHGQKTPGVFRSWLWLIALLVICLAAWAGAVVTVWMLL